MRLSGSVNMEREANELERCYGAQESDRKNNSVSMNCSADFFMDLWVCLPVCTLFHHTRCQSFDQEEAR